jgi:hypothetical protein
MSRSSLLLPAALLGVCSWLLVSQSFLTATPGTSKPQSRTAMRGFKDDFAAWKSTLSGDEKTLLLKQAQSEFDKKFRKSDDFTKDVGSDKIESFSKILQKFFDSEMEDYQKDAGAKTPDYDVLQRKAAQKVYDFSLKQRIVTLDRDADRRYMFASERIVAYNAKGEDYPQSSPFVEKWPIKNDDAESHKAAEFVLEQLKLASKENPNVKAVVDQMKVPAMGEAFEITVPQVVVNQIDVASDVLKIYVNRYAENHTEAETKAFVDKQVPDIWSKAMSEVLIKYYTAKNEIETETEDLKTFFRSQKDMPGKTKADILKEIWAELPKYTEKPLPPLDDEILAELAADPAVNKDIGEFKHSWGTADMLYKSEAIDSFGEKYLLGVFETKEEANKAFVAWNIEYEKAREDMKDEMQQWGKQEQARVDADTTSQERVQKALEEARR